MKKNDLKKTALDFQRGTISRREFIRSVSHLILSIPGKYSNHDIDQRHEYFTNILSRIKDIINAYRPIKNIPFEAWFMIVLKRNYFLFIKQQYTNVTFTTDKIEHIAASSDVPQKEQTTAGRINISTLTWREKKIAALKYGITVPEVNTDETISKIRYQLEIRKNLEDKITHRYCKLLYLYNMLKFEADRQKRACIIEKEEKIKRSKRRLEIKRSKLSVYPTNKWVAGKLGLSEGTISSYISKIKKKLLIHCQPDRVAAELL